MNDFDPAPRPLHRLPRFDVTLMEHVVLGGRDSSLKRDVYALFIKHQDQLLRKSHPVEGLSKSEHRQFVRDCLHLLLKQGYSPLSYFAKDPHSYFNLVGIPPPLHATPPVPLTLALMLTLPFVVL